MNLKIVSHHVGGRDGSIPLPVLPVFAGDILSVIYEADTDALAQIAERWQGKCETRTFSYCLSSGRGEQNFFINYDGYTSSLLPFDNRYASFYMYHPPGNYDYILGEACAPIETRQIQTVTLDDLVGSAEFANLAPDFLSLDSQGSEYLILKGAERTLQRHVLALYTEAEFVPIYRGQKLLPDIQGLLATHGFDLAELSMHEGFSSRRAPVGARGRGFLFGSDVLFLRRWPSLQGAASDEDEYYLMLQKLAFIAALFGFVEYALEVLAAADRIVLSEETAFRISSLSYVIFLRRLRETVACLPQQFPKSVAEYASAEELKVRFQSTKQT
jgi:FkbM family methyltransferase